jgi:hypothetical protein
VHEISINYSFKGEIMKDGHYINSVVFGNTTVELRGYNNEITYAYIGDNDITEMAHELDLWPTFEESIYAQA